MKHRYSFLFLPFQLILDWILLNLSFWIAHVIKFGLSTELNTSYKWFLLVCNLIWLGLIVIVKPYNYTRIKFHVFNILYQYLSLSGVFAACMAFAWIILRDLNLSRLHMLYMLMVFVALGITWRVFAVVFIKFYRASGHNIRRYIIVGHGKLATTLKEFYENYPEFGYEFYGFFGDIDENNKSIMRGDYDRLTTFIKQNTIDCVYCCTPYINNEVLGNIITQSEQENFQVKLVIDFSSILSRQSTVEYHDMLPIIDISNRFWEDIKVQILKRIFDIAFSSFILFLGMPIWIILGLITKFSSKGPIFYSQERIGKSGKPFNIYKFRSMYVNAEQEGPALSFGNEDPRITPWGQFMRKMRLDEIPQFYNVLKGDMSVVGPRPERQFFIDQITPIAPDFTKLLTVKPGITSIGQVKFGYAQNVEEMIQRLEFDLQYLTKVSLFVDMLIIWETVVVMLKAKGK
ncbi:exopolysaccharide biosynthesis polyprenyl glycosylphosphotransferase [Runella sp. CRIBMP]|uniref:sugar transferase n=1 Tax=Runella sp. CRIBMP TaxID=2683261 RepID=UPI001411BAF7|nr:sugar transferase [Runella sp. CRIBMP]NBB19512.1 exopolysaccharide biosynthesis polyprenyl glycosylphosphotransferase [Runella sp. CRIBMP]